MSSYDIDYMSLARRAVAHLEKRSTDQADSIMELPIEAYLDPERYEREVNIVFRHLPLAIALSLELPEPGSYLARNIMDVPVLLVRGDDGTARAFLNVCRHRGAPVVETERGVARRFVCPYHAWSFDTQGRLTGVYGADTFGDVSAETHSLTPLFCAERSGLLWVVLTPGVDFDIDAWLGGFARELDTLQLNDWHLYDQRDIAGPGWKVTWDGYLEAYHHNTVHPETVGKYTIGNLLLHDAWGPHQRIAFGRRSLSQMQQQEESEWQPREHIRLIHSGFPNLSISGVLGDHCLVTQVYPGATPDTTITRQTVLAARKPETAEEKAATETFSAMVLKAVRDEDYRIGLKVQAGLKSGANKVFTIGRNEIAVQHYHRWVARMVENYEANGGVIRAWET